MTGRAPEHRAPAPPAAVRDAARRTGARLLAGASVVALNGCTGVLAPESPQASLVADLWWTMLAVAVLILAGVSALVFASVRRGGRAEPLSATESRRLVLVAGVVVPAVILVGFVAGSTIVARSIASAAPPDALTIEVEGRRWWWAVHYLDAKGNRVATTANEIHVPVGRPVRFLLRSDNVIHSFWVPRLQGKLDMIPGQVNTAWFVPEKAGVYRGQCAEFCGAQHTMMAFEVVAVTDAQFAGWLETQAAPAKVPADADARRGREVFVNARCAECHTIRGTPARGDDGPDLTHVASRRTLAAGAIPNTRGHLAGWIADPQSVKRASLMPRVELSPDELHAVLAYLETLE